MKRKKSPLMEEASECGMKHRILHAALILMSKKGLEKTSVNDIVRAVNVSKPVLYYYFKNKEDLCRQLIKESVRVMNQELHGGSAPKHLSYEERLGILLQANLSCFRHNRDIGELVMKGLFTSKDAGFVSLLQNIRDARRGAIKKVLEQAADDGYLPHESLEDLSHIMGALLLYCVAYGGTELLPVDDNFGKRMSRLLLNGPKASASRSRK